MQLRTAIRSATASIALAGICAVAPALAQAPASHQHAFTDAEKWAKSFDDPARDSWQKPHEVITALGLTPDAVVADIGSGTGYFAVRIAHFVPKGKVYGVDTEPEMVAHLARRAKQMGLENVTSLGATMQAPALPQKADLALLVDVYHHISARPAYFRKLGESLKPGGRIAIIDFNATSTVGPPVHERISAAQVKAEMREAGYRLLSEPGFLPNQYFLIFAAAS